MKHIWTQGDHMMIKDRYFKFWYDYHNGRINRKLTEEESSRIVIYDDWMNQLVPTDELLRIVGDLDNLMHTNIKKLAKKFGVLDGIISCKINYLIEEHNNETKKDQIKKKILKKEGNIITVNFN